jgi:hypothetical protein
MRRSRIPQDLEQLSRAETALASRIQSSNGGGGIRTLVGPKWPETVFETIAEGAPSSPACTTFAKSYWALRDRFAIPVRFAAVLRVLRGSSRGSFSEVVDEPINVNGPIGRSSVACWVRVAFRAATSTSQSSLSVESESVQGEAVVLAFGPLRGVLCLTRLAAAWGVSI